MEDQAPIVKKEADIKDELNVEIKKEEDQCVPQETKPKKQVPKKKKKKKDYKDHEYEMEFQKEDRNSFSNSFKIFLKYLRNFENFDPDFL